MTQTIVISTYEISGLRKPVYNSGAANKRYVDIISGNLNTKIDEAGSFDSADYITSTNAIARFADSSNVRSRFVASSLSLTRYNQYAGHSGQSNKHVDHSTVSIDTSTGLTGGGNLTSTRTLSVIGYATISSNAKQGQNISLSGNKYTWAYDSMVASGNEIYAAYKHSANTTPHASVSEKAKWNDIAGSGIKYTWAYKSVIDSGVKWYSAYKHSANKSLHSFTVADYITSTNAITRFADSSNVRYRFVASSISLARYNQYVGHSGNTNVHTNATEKSKWNDIAGSGIKYTWAYKSILDSGIRYTKAYKSASTGVFALQSINLTAGNGLTGGGTLAAARTFAVGAGTGITVASDTISVTNYNQIVGNSNSGQVAQKHLLDSGSKYHNAYVSTSTGIFEPALTKGALTATSPIALSNSTRQLIGGSAVVSISNYIGSTQAIARFPGSSTAIAKYYASSAGRNYAFLHSSNNTIHLKGISSPKSGQVPTWGSNLTAATWQNVLPPMTVSIANVRLSAQQNINMARFTCPQGKKAYIWHATACGSGGSTIGNLQIQMLSGTTNVYKTSSATLQLGYPLAVSNGGNTEIRFMYSGTSAVTGIKYGTAIMNFSVY